MNKKKISIYLVGLLIGLVSSIRMLWISIKIFLYGKGILIEPNIYILSFEIISLIIGSIILSLFIVILMIDLFLGDLK